MDCGSYWISTTNFYPRPPHGGRLGQLGPALLLMGFLPTPSAWRATHTSGILSPPFLYFYPRPPHGGRPWTTSSRRTSGDFYPRPPHGGRPSARRWARRRRGFLPTPSAWRATTMRPRRCWSMMISTHALRMEGDDTPIYHLRVRLEFLPTPSAWRATRSGITKDKVSIFLPTPSAWRATHP